MDFEAPKRLTISPGLTITKVRIWRPKPSEHVENSKILSQLAFFSHVFFGSVGGQID